MQITQQTYQGFLCLCIFCCCIVADKKCDVGVQNNAVSALIFGILRIYCGAAGDGEGEGEGVTVVDLLGVGSTVLEECCSLLENNAFSGSSYLPASWREQVPWSLPTKRRLMGYQ